MKLQKLPAFALAFALTSGIAYGAEQAQTLNNIKTPELAQADKQVSKMKDELELARKQLTAARANVRAAEAEFKAATTNRNAVALRDAAIVANQQAVISPVVPIASTQGISHKHVNQQQADLRQAPVPTSGSSASDDDQNAPSVLP